MKKLKLWLSAGLFVSVVGGSVVAAGVSDPAYAVNNITDCKPESQFLTFPMWFRGLLVLKNGSCEINSPEAVGGLSNFIWIIVLNIIDIALNAVGYVAGGFIIYGGFLLMTSRGVPDNISKARLTIRDAAIGLVISFASVAVINLIVDNVIK